MFLLSCIALVAVIAASDSSAGHAFEGKLLIPAPSQCRVFLNAGQMVAIPKANGAFSFVNLSPGTYLLTVESLHYKFKPIRIEILPKGRVRCRYLLEGSAAIPLPLKLSPEMKYDFFEPVAAFDPLAFFRNPMIILMGFTLLMGLALPKLIESIDTEESNPVQTSSATKIRSVSAR